MKETTENSLPKVSICCLTYNHEKYLKQCLDGFVNQKTSFDYEILVHEDASTDNTASILKEYEIKYPKLFKCIYQKENQFSKQNTLVNILFEMAQGDYLALCEGDDFWTDPYKLQKQVDFLESNRSYNFSGHSVDCTIPDAFNSKLKFKKTGRIPLKQLIYTNCIHTSSFVFRNLPRNEEFFTFFNNTPLGDFPQLVYFSQDKGAYVFKESMSTYRTDNSASEWNGKLENKQRVDRKELVIKLMVSSSLFSPKAKKYLKRGMDGKQPFIIDQSIKRLYRRVKKRIKMAFNNES